MREALQIFPVRGLPEFRPGDDLAAAIAAAAPWLAAGDVLVVTSKAVSKVEGALIRTPRDAAGREAARQAAVLAEATAVVARLGPTTITRTRHGFVMAASGVDASNVRGDELALLPVDSDRSARSLRTRLAELLDVDVGVVISDTMGRPWRAGLTDVAIGVAGLAPLRDHRGAVDGHGNELLVTEIAEADEIAAAGELVKGKLDGVPVAVVRGLGPRTDGAGVTALLRPVAQDMFRLGTRDVVPARTDVRDYTDAAVDPAAVQRALAAAETALGDPAAVWRVVPVEAETVRRRVLAAVGVAHAPVLLAPCLLGPPEPASLLTAGAALQNLLVQLSAEGLGAQWYPAPPPGLGLDVPPGWAPLGVVTAGLPAAR